MSCAVFPPALAPCDRSSAAPRDEPLAPCDDDVSLAVVTDEQSEPSSIPESPAGDALPATLSVQEELLARLTNDLRLVATQHDEPAKPPRAARLLKRAAGRAAAVVAAALSLTAGLVAVR